MNNKMIGIITFLLISMSMVGCAAKIAMAPAEKNDEAKKFAPLKEKSRIYVYRPSQMLGMLHPLNIKINNKFWGPLMTNTFLMLDVPPGEHKLTAGYRGDKAILRHLTVTTEKGKMYFFESMYDLGTFSLRQVPEAEGKENIVDSELSSSLLN